MTKLEKVLYAIFVTFTLSIAALAVAGVFLTGVIVAIMTGTHIPGYLDVVIKWVLFPAVYLIGGVFFVSGAVVGLARLIRGGYECRVCGEKMPVVFERNAFGDPLCEKMDCLINSTVYGMTEHPEETQRILNEQAQGNGPKFIQA